jgi:hypothetical protein
MRSELLDRPLMFLAMAALLGAVTPMAESRAEAQPADVSIGLVPGTSAIKTPINVTVVYSHLTGLFTVSVQGLPECSPFTFYVVPCGGNPLDALDITSWMTVNTETDSANGNIDLGTPDPWIWCDQCVTVGVVCHSWYDSVNVTVECV